MEVSKPRSVIRPLPVTVMNALLEQGMPKPLLAAYCGVCGKRIGIVVATVHGPLWLGFLHNRSGSRAVNLAGFPQGSQVPHWLDEPRPWLTGECDCRRNSVLKPPVVDALRARQARVRVPAQDDTPSG